MPHLPSSATLVNVSDDRIDDLRERVDEAALAIIIRHIERLEGRIVTIQDDINAFASQVATSVDQLKGALAAIDAELKAAVTANPSVDLSALSTAVSNLQSVTGALVAEGTPVPAPAPAPAPASPGASGTPVA